MASLVKIEDRKVPPMFYKKRPVVTLRQVDEFHGRPANTAKRNFSQNRKHFIQDEDFFEAPYEEWSELLGGETAGRNSSSGLEKNEGIGGTNFVLPKSEKGGHRGNMILLTETGYLMVVKSLTDDKAWAIHRAMVKAYFNKKEPNKPLTQEEREQIQNLFLTDISINHIARDLGRSRSAVQRCCRDLLAQKAGQLSLFS